LVADGVRNVIRRAFGRCGIKATGPHILRQSWRPSRISGELTSN